MVNFMFRNGQLTGEIFDDNSGRTWTIYLRGWAEKAIGDLEQKISEAQAHGLDTTKFEEILRDAREYLSSNDYELVVDTIGNATGTVERNMVLSIYEIVLSKYEEAVQEGLSIPRAEIFLFAAREAIDVENYSGSKSYLDTVIRLVEEARAKVDERFLAPLILLIILLRKVMR
jgi:hypothetical protein